MSREYYDGGKEMIEGAEWVVVMTDNFFSGWGKAANQTNKYIVCCDTKEQAEIVKANACKRNEMEKVTIRETLPPNYINNNSYRLSIVKFSELGTIWTEV